jgi:hypothetical protein
MAAVPCHFLHLSRDSPSCSPDFRTSGAGTAEIKNSNSAPESGLFPKSASATYIINFDDAGLFGFPKLQAFFNALGEKGQ